jgi:hypothetical protein
MIQNNTKYMTDHEYNELVTKCIKDAYEYSLEELESMIDTGYDCRKDYWYDRDLKMVHHCNVVIRVLEEVNEKRLKAKKRTDKISEILNEPFDTQAESKLT